MRGSVEPINSWHNYDKGAAVIWDFLQRYDDSWIWRREDRHDVTESSRNFAALEECIADATRHGYTATEPRRRRHTAAGTDRSSRRSK